MGKLPFGISYPKWNNFHMQDNDLNNDLRSRVRSRLAELDLSPITAAQKVGLERTYIRDFIKGKKDSIRSDKYEQVAEALGWTINDLLGTEEDDTQASIARQQIQELKDASGLSWPDLAEMAGIDTPLLRDFAVGKRRISRQFLIKFNELALKSAFGVGAKQDSSLASVPGDQLVGARDFPIYAAAQGGDGFMIVHSDVMEYVKRPVILEGVPDSYGILVVGDSMVPAYRPGDMALVHPRRPIERDSDVILYDHDHRTGDAKSMIKHLASFNDRSYKLEQYNPAKSFSEHKADWPICHQVVGMYKGRR